MKFTKPVYDSSQKLYKASIQDGLSFTSEYDLESAEWSPPLDLCYPMHKDEILKEVLVATKGWFTKPLTEDWLQSRIEISLPDAELLVSGFEGTAEWQLKTLLISKEKFLFLGDIVKTVKKERIELALEEERGGGDLEDAEEVEWNPPAVQQAPLELGPTRRMMQKEFVLQSRHKAAKALFNANQLTREYCDLYGDDTDWEDDDSDSDSGFEE